MVTDSVNHFGADTMNLSHKSSGVLLWIPSSIAEWQAEPWYDLF